MSAIGTCNVNAGQSLFQRPLEKVYWVMQTEFITQNTWVGEVKFVHPEAERVDVICCKKMMHRHAANKRQQEPSEKSQFRSYKLERNTAHARWHFAPGNTAKNNVFLKCILWHCIICLHLMNVMWRWLNAVCYLSWNILELLWTNIKEAVKLSHFVKATQRL